MTAKSAISIEVDVGSASSRGRTPDQAWLVRLRNADRTVIIAIGLRRHAADRLALQIDNLLNPTNPTPANPANPLTSIGASRAAVSGRRTRPTIVASGEGTTAVAPSRRGHSGFGRRGRRRNRSGSTNRVSQADDHYERASSAVVMNSMLSSLN